MPRIPNRWLPYSAVGKLISGTRFIAFKVPLSEALNKNLGEQERFSPAHLMEICPKLSLVVDLTNTKKYYNKDVFTSNAIAHEKIFCPGIQVPHDSLAKRFNEIVDSFLRTNEDPDGLIGVHCTHGVNRTGYFICRYMIERMGMTPESAVKAFQEARGHVIERGNYVHDLKNGCRGGPDVNVNNSKTSYKRKANSKSHNGDGVHKMDTKKMSLNKKNVWHNCNNNYNAYQKDPSVNSGIDYGYESPMSSGYRQSNKGHPSVNSGIDYGYDTPMSSGYGQSNKGHPFVNSGIDYGYDTPMSSGYRQSNKWHPSVNSGIDYGYDTPMSSGYGQSNRGRYGNQRENYERGYSRQRNYRFRGNHVRGKYRGKNQLIDGKEKNYTKSMGELYIQTKRYKEKHSTKTDQNTAENNGK